MNYFNYFTEIEDAFVRRRGKHMMLSPMDWALIESWKAIEVPLHVALRGIEKAFDSWESKPRKRTVKSLLYCQEEVEAQYAEWREARVGATPLDGNADGGAAEESLPFSRNAVLEHLERGQTGLRKVLEDRKRIGEDELCETLERSISLLDALSEDFKSAALLDAQKLETSLTGIERMLSDALRSGVPSEKLNELQSEVKTQLKPYRKQMDTLVYQQTFDNLLLKRLREQFGIPRLSLFYL